MKHPICELDRAILKYLNATLEEELGEPFKNWAKTCEESVRRGREITREMGRKILSRPEGELMLQEQLVPGGVAHPQRREAWAVLMKSVTPTQKVLCELYQEVLFDLSDIENMELAIQIAEESGDELHLEKVKRILDLDKITEPTWW